MSKSKINYLSIFLLIILIHSISLPKLLAQKASSEAKVAPTTENDDSIETLRARLAEKIKTSKSKKTVYLGFIESLSDEDITLRMLDKKIKKFRFDPNITDLNGASNSANTKSIKLVKDDLVSIMGDESSATLALSINKHTRIEFVFGEVVAIDTEKNNISIVNSITRLESEISLSKNPNMLLPEPKTFELKKIKLNKIKIGDILHISVLPKDKKGDVINPSKIVVIPKELIK